MADKLFEVDRKGLAKIAQRRGKAFVIYELLQNSWDADGSTHVEMTLTPIDSSPFVRVVIEDDAPEGFHDLAHAWTLFAESSKKPDPQKRGRFNIGEKLIIACCRTCEIITVSGGVRFDEEGRHTLRTKRDHGSVFTAEMRMTRDELEEVLKLGRLVLPPAEVRTTLNGEELSHHQPLGVENATLQTEVADADGYLIRRERQTEIHVHEPMPDSPAMIYELGIPVMELEGDRWSVDIQQKIPLTLERDGVHPAYLRRVRAIVLNTMSREIRAKDAGAGWVKDALSSPLVTEQAVRNVLDAGFGKKHVTYDPSDTEANSRAMAAGYTIIPAASLPAAAWENVRRASASLPAGKVTPSPRPFSPDGDPLKILDEENWTPGIRAVVEYAKRMAKIALGRTIDVVIANDFGWPHAGAFGEISPLYLNLGRLGHAWFNGERGVEKVDALLIHEFAHGHGAKHLSEDFFDECCRIGAVLKAFTAKNPERADPWGKHVENR